MKPTRQELLVKVDNILKEEGAATASLTTEEKLQNYILPGLKISKSTLASLYGYKPKQYGGILGKLKYKVLNKLKHVVLNVVERESMRQQKFNELTVKAIEALVEENKSLRERLQEGK